MVGGQTRTTTKKRMREMKKTKKTIGERLDALKAAHPDMIWEYGSSQYYRGGIPVMGYFIKAICPEGYCIWPRTGNVTLSAKYDLMSDVYSVTGAKRKVTELENMDWRKWDEIAKKARKQFADLNGKAVA